MEALNFCNVGRLAGLYLDDGDLNVNDQKRLEPGSLGVA